jgi:hypothetical protein
MKMYCNETVAPPDTRQFRALPLAYSGGLYVVVLSGYISASPLIPTDKFPGQFGFTPASVTPPVVLPPNPNLLFIPPASSFTSTPTTSNSTGQPAVDCAVRARPHARSSRFATSTSSGKGADVAAGDVLMFQIGGLAAHSPVSTYLNAGTTPIGTLRTDDSGYLSGWIRVPAGTPLGTNSFQVAGVLDGNQSVSMITGFTVHAPKATVLTRTVGLSAGSTTLPASSTRALRTLLTQIPATVPSTCTVTSSFVPSSRTTVRAQIREAKALLAASGLSCTEATKQGSVNMSKVSVHTTR